MSMVTQCYKWTNNLTFYFLHAVFISITHNKWNLNSVLEYCTFPKLFCSMQVMFLDILMKPTTCYNYMCTLVFTTVKLTCKLYSATRKDWNHRMYIRNFLDALKIWTLNYFSDWNWIVCNMLLLYIESSTKVNSI